MYIVEMLKNGEWKKVSTHTKSEDADRQMDIFKTNGYDEQMRVTFEEDNAPSDQEMGNEAN